ncbi:MAG: hypothetical protein HYU97_08465 [Deltaproteobacteria bacterium]|nr:hypothetical protein [Deltaproteobacteria bacterium]
MITLPTGTLKRDELYTFLGGLFVVSTYFVGSTYCSNLHQWLKQSAWINQNTNDFSQIVLFVWFWLLSVLGVFLLNEAFYTFLNKIYGKLPENEDELCKLAEFKPNSSYIYRYV